jgi:hypothetical protein
MAAIPDKVNVDDPAAMHKFQLWIKDICNTTDENPISQEQAAKLAAFMVDPRVWPCIRYSIPYLTIKT